MCDDLDDAFDVVVEDPKTSGKMPEKKIYPLEMYIVRTKHVLQLVMQATLEKHKKELEKHEHRVLEEHRRE